MQVDIQKKNIQCHERRCYLTQYMCKNVLHCCKRYHKKSSKGRYTLEIIMKICIKRERYMMNG